MYLAFFKYLVTVFNKEIVDKIPIHIEDTIVFIYVTEYYSLTAYTKHSCPLKISISKLKKWSAFALYNKMETIHPTFYS